MHCRIERIDAPWQEQELFIDIPGPVELRRQKSDQYPVFTQPLERHEKAPDGMLPCFIGCHIAPVPARGMGNLAHAGPIACVHAVAV